MPLRDLELNGGQKLPVLGEDEEAPQPARPSPGRLLNRPKMHYIPKLSLPQLLATYVTPRDKKADNAFGVVPASAESDKIKQRRMTRKTRIDITPMDVDESGWPISGGGLGAFKKAQELFDTDIQISSRNCANWGWSNQKPGSAAGNEECEFVRKRREHPRLRWPRLASRGEPAVAESECDTESMNGTMQIGGSSGSGANRSGSSLRPGSLGLGLGMKSARSKAQGKGPGAPVPPTRPKPSARPAILPRVKSRAAIRPGTASTLHAPVGEEDDQNLWDDYLHNSQTSLFSSSTQFSQGISIGGGSSASQEHRIDRKWFMRMTPISCLPSEPNLKAARRAIAEQNHAVHGEAGEYLNFKRWGINDDYIDALLQAHCESTQQGLSGVHYMNLSENQLTEHGIAKLTKHGVPDSLVSLNLSENRLGQRGGLAVVALVQHCKRLADLDLSGNPLGDVVVMELFAMLEQHGTELEGLGLARCNLGTSPKSGSAGDALGKFVKSASRLKSLDLHWNMLNSSGGHAFLQGLYDNGTTGHCLRQVNLAWNRLGSGLRCDDLRKQDALRSAKLLASVFFDGEVLFHLDLSYNGFDSEECEILAKGLKYNNTLFGLHLMGNEATIDDLGFVAPIKRMKIDAPPQPEAVQAPATDGEGDAPPVAPESDTIEEESLAVPIMQAEEQRLRLNSCVHNVPAKFVLQHGADTRQPRGKEQDWMPAHFTGGLRSNPSLHSLDGDGVMCFSEGDLQNEQQWVEHRSRVQPLGHSIGDLAESLERNAKCCWICENWVEHKVCYIPGLSGPEPDPAGVQSVHAFYSIDGFSRPTKLSKSQDNPMSGARHSVKLSSDVMSQLMMQQTGGATLADSSNVSDKKMQTLMQRRMSRRASRAIPMHNITKFVGIRMLPPTLDPLEVIFFVDGHLRVASDLKKRKLPFPKTISLKHVQSDGEVGSSKVVQVTEVNVIPAAVSFWEGVQSGMSGALCVLEDPVNRNEFTVFPRKLAEVTVKPKEYHEWTFENSSFKDFRRDNDPDIQKCFDTDWSHSRLNQILKEESSQKCVKDYMRKHYLAVILCFQQQAYTGFDGKVHAAGISFINFREWLVQAGGTGPGKLIDGQACKLNDPDCIFIAANVIDRNKRKDFKVMPEKGLARFQFQEALVRVAFRRFLTSSAAKATPDACRTAVESTMDMLHIGQEMLTMRQQLHSALFTEECCMVVRENMEVLTSVYDGYKMVSCYPGRAGKFMSYGAWMEFVVDANFTNDEDFSSRHVGLAFALAREIRIDITKDWRHMELSFTEFILAIAALFVLRKEYCKEFLADLLEEAFADNLQEARHKVLNKKAGKARNNVTYDASMAPLVSFLGRMFEDADDDGSGTVDQREFRRVFSQPEHQAEMSRLGVNVSELEMLFRALDKDGSGELTLEVLCDGFIKMKQAMKGIDRAISYIRKAFAEVDEDNSGTLDTDEFRNLFETPGVRKKLGTLGISADDVADMILMVEKDGQSEVSINDIIANFVRLRDPKNAGLRGVRLLEKLFEEADADQSGELSKEEVEEAFGSQFVAQKLEKMKLRVPDWSTLFEELDVDGSGGLSWEELDDGMRAFWAKDTLSSM